MQLIVDYEVTPGGNFMKQSACASISRSPTWLGCFILMILYRKISEKSRPTKNCDRGGVVIICEICRRSPCDSRCPNAPEPLIVHECSLCGELIREGDTFYSLGEYTYCEECVAWGRGEAEFPYEFD